MRIAAARRRGGIAHRPAGHGAGLPTNIGRAGRLCTPMDSTPPEIAETLEGSTRLLVPAASLSERVPPREPAFFNPRARLSRDVSVAAYSAFAAGLGRPAVMLEALSGLGARGLRAANESDVGLVVLNDLNAAALGLAARSAAANGLANVEMSRREACAFLLSRQWGCDGDGDGGSGGGGRARRRADIVDIDPFGSPAPYLDCCLRAVSRGGMLSMTATDLQVLNGVFPAACVRRYGGAPMRRSGFGDEMSLRLMLGCLCSIAGRLDLSVEPLLVHSDQHYYRAYARIAGRADQTGMLGRLHLCRRCGWRAAAAAARGPRGRGGRRGKAPAPDAPAPLPECPECAAPAPDSAGPLWAGPTFDAQFARLAAARAASLPVGRECGPLLERAAAEAAMPAAYHTLDEAASRAGTHPPRLDRMVASLRSAGYAASPTSLCPTGFRTDAPPSAIAGALRGAAR